MTRVSLAVLSTLLTAAAAPNGRAATYADLLRGLPASPLRATTNYTKITFDAAAYPLARCLDSGPGAVYVRPASSPSGAAKVKIFFQGGAGATRQSAFCQPQSAFHPPLHI